MTPRSLLVSGRHAGGTILRTQTDERLVELTRAGYESAFEAVVIRYRPALLRYCLRFLPPERAEDAVQQTLVSTYEKILSGNGDMDLRPWLYRVARNTAIDSLRDRSRHHEQVDESFDGVERPDQAAERRQSVRDALTALQALPSRQRDAVVLRELEGRSYDEISMTLGVTPGATRQLLARARDTLRSGVRAITPAALFHRLPAGGPTESLAGRFSDFCNTAGAGAGTVVAQLGVSAIVVSGVAVAPFARDAEEGRIDSPPAAVQVRAAAVAPATTSPDRSSKVESKDTSGPAQAPGKAPAGDRPEGSGPAVQQPAPASATEVAVPAPADVPFTSGDSGLDGALLTAPVPVRGTDPGANSEGTAETTPCEPGDASCGQPDPGSPEGPPPPEGGEGSGAPVAGMEGRLPGGAPAGAPAGS